MGGNHLRVLNQMKSVEVIGFYDPFVENDGSTPFTHFSSMQELLSAKPDYVVIATPTSSHLEIVQECVESKVSFLLEKPISDSLISTKEIVSICEQAGIKSAVGHIERFNPSIIELKKRLKSGEIGEVYSVVTNRQSPYPGRIGDVGVSLDLATHDIDLTRWILEDEYQFVFSLLSFNFSETHEDQAIVSAKTKRNINVSHHINWLSPVKVRSVEILGSNGKYYADLLNSDLSYFEFGGNKLSHDVIAHFNGPNIGEVRKFSFDKQEPLLTEHQEFQKHLMNQEGNIVTLRSGMQNIKIAEAIVRSGKENSIVFI